MMVSVYGKKFIVISQEEYDRLIRKQAQKVFNPRKGELYQREREMKEVLDEPDIPNDEKIRLFTENLNSMRKRYDELVKPKPLKIVMEAKESRESGGEAVEEPKTEEYSMEDSLINSLPKLMQNNAQLILNHLKNYSKIIKWNESGEIIYKDETINGSNLTDLVANVLSPKNSSTPPLLHETIFLKALSETNVPELWIKNKSKKKLLQSYRDVKSENQFASPTQNKKPKILWSSST